MKTINQIKKIGITSWVCQEKIGSNETLVLSGTLEKCPVIVHDKNGDVIVGIVHSCQWDRTNRRYYALVYYYSVLGPDGFTDEGVVEMIWNKKDKSCVPFALVVERV